MDLDSGMSTKYTALRVEEIGNGYEADGGGYQFEQSETFPGSLIDESGEILGEYTESCVGDTIVFTPFEYDVTWCPIVLDLENEGMIYVLKESGKLRGSDRECRDCAYIAGMENGETGPCSRAGCEDGYLESVGGCYAVYESEDIHSYIECKLGLCELRGGPKTVEFTSFECGLIRDLLFNSSITVP